MNPGKVLAKMLTSRTDSNSRPPPGRIPPAAPVIDLARDSVALPADDKRYPIVGRKLTAAAAGIMSSGRSGFPMSGSSAAEEEEAAGGRVGEKKRSGR